MGSKVAADGDCCHEIKRHLLLGRKAITTLDSILKSRDLARAMGARHVSKLEAGALRTAGRPRLRLPGRASPYHLLPQLRKLTSPNNRPREDSWLKSLFVQKVDPRKDAHSNLIIKKETRSLYKLVSQCDTGTPRSIQQHLSRGVAKDS